MTDAAGVTAEGIRKSFGSGPRVLAGVDIHVAAGSTLALLGPSGSGKTTLLRVIAGLERPDAGTVTVGDRLLTSERVVVPPEQRHIGMVFQDWALFPHLDVARNVGFGLPRGMRRDSQRIAEALEMVGLDDHAQRMPATLSGGQQQRVALARAIAPRPSVLLLDEPFSNLDASLRARVRTEIHQLLIDLGITTIFVTHDQDEAFVLGDEVVVLDDGRVVQAAPPAELYRSPVTRWLAAFVGEANFVDGSAEGDVALTALGTVPLQHTARGPVEVLVRPEEIHLDPAGAENPGAEGVVELVEFFGHSTGYRVRVNDMAGVNEMVLSVRRASIPVVGRGDTVHLTYAGGPAMCFGPDQSSSR